MQILSMTHLRRRLESVLAPMVILDLTSAGCKPGQVLLVKADNGELQGNKPGAGLDKPDQSNTDIPLIQETRIRVRVDHSSASSRHSTCGGTRISWHVDYFQQQGPERG